LLRKCNIIKEFDHFVKDANPPVNDDNSVSNGNSMNDDNYEHIIKIITNQMASLLGKWINPAYKNPILMLHTYLLAITIYRRSTGSHCKFYIPSYQEYLWILDDKTVCENYASNDYYLLRAYNLLHGHEEGEEVDDECNSCSEDDSHTDFHWLIWQVIAPHTHLSKESPAYKEILKIRCYTFQKLHDHFKRSNDIASMHSLLNTLFKSETPLSNIYKNYYQFDLSVYQDLITSYFIYYSNLNDGRRNQSEEEIIKEVNRRLHGISSSVRALRQSMSEVRNESVNMAVNNEPTNEPMSEVKNESMPVMNEMAVKVKANEFKNSLMNKIRESIKSMDRLKEIEARNITKDDESKRVSLKAINHIKQMLLCIVDELCDLVSKVDTTTDSKYCYLKHQLAGLIPVIAEIWFEGTYVFRARQSREEQILKSFDMLLKQRRDMRI